MPTNAIWAAVLGQVCLEHDTEHRFIKPNHPWTNGQVERMIRTLKEATVRRYTTHLSAFPDAYNFAKRLKTVNGLTPYETICKAWTDEPDRFIRNPNHLMMGLNT
jgi:transposase InsO family protein